MAKPITLAQFLYCHQPVQRTFKPSLLLVRALTVRCKAQYPTAPKQFISRHLYLQLCWQAIYAYCYWFACKQSTADPINMPLAVNGAYCRGFNLNNDVLVSKAEQTKAFTHFISQVGEWVNTDYALGKKEQARLLLDSLSSAIERAHSLALATTLHINNCHRQLHTLICEHFSLDAPFTENPQRLACCRYYLACYSKCQTCPKKDINTNEPTS